MFSLSSCSMCESCLGLYITVRPLHKDFGLILFSTLHIQSAYCFVLCTHNVVLPSFSCSFVFDLELPNQIIC